MANRFQYAPEREIKAVGLADENTSARVLLEHYADELKKFRSKKAARIADEILAIAQKINEFHWQAPKAPWN
jgi:hypothetical protein